MALGAGTPMSIGQQVKASVTGNVETALLTIYDHRGAAAETANPAAGVGGGVGRARSMSLSGTAPSLPSVGGGRQRSNSLPAGGAGRGSSMLNTITGATSSQSPTQSAVLSGAQQALSTGTAAQHSNSVERILRVQFNPSQLTINASAIPQGRQDAISGRPRVMTMEDAKVRLAVTLFFDDMQTYDAFMWDKFTAGLTLQGGVNVVKTFLREVHSVKGQVEALIAALRNPHTRKIGFRWNTFSFIGRLNTLQARYTMFSTSGRPVRAEVRLFIQQDMDPAVLQDWYDCYEQAFGGDTGNLVKTEQNWGNLLNLNL